MAKTTSGERTTAASIWYLERGLPDQSGGDVIAMLMSGGTRQQPTAQVVSRTCCVRWSKTTARKW